MTQPLVCAVCLTADRPQMLARAVECFRRQTYANKQLLVFDTGMSRPEWSDYLRIYSPGDRRCTVGGLRNIAIANAVGRGVWHLGRNNFVVPEIIMHWDDDDWSHPNRMAEQVALLQESGAHLVGYRDMLFWRMPYSRRGEQAHSDDCTCGTCGPGKRTVIWGEHFPGEAWFYNHGNSPYYALGTSFCYWRRTWEAKPFPDTSYGEDTQWAHGLKVFGVPSFVHDEDDGTGAPRMVATIHGNNTSNAYGTMLSGKCSEFRRAPEWDSYCRRLFEAKQEVGA